MQTQRFSSDNESGIENRIAEIYIDENGDLPVVNVQSLHRIIVKPLQCFCEDLNVYELYNVSYLYRNTNNGQQQCAVTIDQLCHESNSFRKSFKSLKLRDDLNTIDTFIYLKERSSFEKWLTFIKNEPTDFHNLADIVQCFIFADNYGCKTFIHKCGTTLLKQLQSTNIKSIYDQTRMNINKKRPFINCTEKYIRKIQELYFSQALIKPCKILKTPFVLHDLYERDFSPVANESIRFFVNKEIQIYGIGIRGLVTEGQKFYVRTIIQNLHEYEDGDYVENEFCSESIQHQQIYELYFNDYLHILPYTHYTITVEFTTLPQSLEESEGKLDDNRCNMYYCNELPDAGENWLEFAWKDGFKWFIDYEGLPQRIPVILYKTYPHLIHYSGLTV